MKPGANELSSRLPRRQFRRRGQTCSARSRSCAPALWRSVVLIDPAFEDAADFGRLAEGIESAHRKWAGGIYLLWYPRKDSRAPEALAGRLRRSRIGKILRVEISLPVPKNPERLT